MPQLKHYKLYHQNFLELNSKLNSREILIYLYLASKFPFHDSKIEIDTALIAEQLGYHRRTVQLVVKKLVAEKLIDIEITRFKYRLAKHGCNSIVTKPQITSVTRESIDRHGESIDRHSESIDRQRVLEPAPSKDFKSLQTLQTLQTKKTLSDPQNLLNNESTKVVGRERENFFTFNSEEEVSQKKEKKENSLSNESKLDRSASLSKKPSSRPKPINSTSGEKDAAPCSVNEVKQTTKELELKSLAEQYGFYEALRALQRDKPDFLRHDYEPFLAFSRNVVDRLPKPPADVDAYVVSRLDSLICQFKFQQAKKQQLSAKPKANNVQRQLQAYFGRSYYAWLKEQELEDTHWNHSRFREDIWEVHLRPQILRKLGVKKTNE